MNTMSVADFLAVLLQARARLPAAQTAALHHVGETVERAAKDLIGTEDESWAPLAESTVSRKSAKGQTGRISATDPLYATGALLISIEHSVEGYVVVVGTHDEIGVYQEFGTERITPRPFLSTALHRNEESAIATVAEAITLTLAGKTFKPAAPRSRHE